MTIAIVGHKAAEPPPCRDSAAGGLLVLLFAMFLLNVWSLWRWRLTLKAWGKSLDREEEYLKRERSWLLAQLAEQEAKR